MTTEYDFAVNVKMFQTFHTTIEILINMQRKVSKTFVIKGIVCSLNEIKTHFIINLQMKTANFQHCL